VVHWSFLLNFVWRWAASEVDERGLEGCKVFFLGCPCHFYAFFHSFYRCSKPHHSDGGGNKKKASFGTPFRAEQVSRSCCQRGSEWCGVLTGAAFIFGHG
jgi:hypothetical protein